MDRKLQTQLANLAIAEMALRDNLHVHFLDDTARAHMDRALAHIREAAIITEGGSNGRSVEELTRQLTGFERLLAFLSARPRASISDEHSWQSGQHGV